MSDRRSYGTQENSIQNLFGKETSTTPSSRTRYLIMRGDDFSRLAFLPSSLIDSRLLLNLHCGGLVGAI